VMLVVASMILTAVNVACLFSSFFIKTRVRVSGRATRAPPPEMSTAVSKTAGRRPYSSDTPQNCSKRGGGNVFFVSLCSSELPTSYHHHAAKRHSSCTHCCLDLSTIFCRRTSLFLRYLGTSVLLFADITCIQSSLRSDNGFPFAAFSVQE
jgi:hypothetical protein